MGGVDIIDQKTAAYRLDCKRKFRFYLMMFFNLIGIAIVNSYIVYTKLGNSISLLDFKIVVAKSLIGRYSNRQRSFPLSRTNKEIPTHMPEFNEKGMQCNFCKNEGAGYKNFCILSDLWSVLVLYQREKLLSKTLCLDFIEHIYCSFVKNVI